MKFSMTFGLLELRSVVTIVVALWVLVIWHSISVRTTIPG
jgi:hypothetical protein